MKDITDYILNLIYPNTCGMCGKICNNSLCKKCEIKIKKYEINSIRKYRKRYFTIGIHICKYEGLIRQKIIEYKFHNKAYLYKTFSKIILKNKKICGILKKYDIIIPVPIHKKRKQARGYNQTELIAKEIAKYANINFEKKILLKQKNIIAQSELSKEKRKENIKNAFTVKNIEKIINKKILIFDDIYTTGSTAQECSRVLKNAGAKEIGILTIAKD